MTRKEILTNIFNSLRYAGIVWTKREFANNMDYNYSSLSSAFNGVERYLTDRFFLHNMNIYLKKLGRHYNTYTKKWEGEAICPSVSQYWARYTVATLAAENGASMDAIGALLGHSQGGKVTSIYIRTNRNKQADETLRGVLDLLK